MAEKHEDLVGLPDRDLRLRAGDATHQHYKGGLYKLLGPVRDSVTGQPLRYRASGEAILIYEHVYPHARELWARGEEEFNQTLPDGTPRFRRLG
jgi:hypothetical protein